MHTDRVAADEARRIARFELLAADLKRKAAAEVLETKADLARARRVSRTAQVLDYLFLLVYSLIGLQIGLELFGARQASAFKRVLDFLCAPLLGPFRGLLPDPALGPAQLMLSYLVALVVYVILHQALDRLLQLIAKRPAKA